jgi:3-deoxy-D-manno-octulosonic-acid transferase
VIAPRHPERFESVVNQTQEYRSIEASSLLTGMRTDNEFARIVVPEGDLTEEVIVLNTVGDLAAVYALADVAFVGGSLVPKGGHNPLEPAQFGVPVVIGSSYENFRGIIGMMESANGIRIVQDDVELEEVLLELLTNKEAAKAMGERGRRVFEEQQGATKRAVEAIVAMVKR